MTAGQATRIALGWDRPWLESAVDRLAELNRCRFPADLGDCWVVMPTAEAGRLLREALALRFADLGGVTSLRVTLPEMLLQPEGAVADSAMVLIRWVELLRSLPSGACPNLFKNDLLRRYGREDGWLLGIARQFQQCRLELAGEALNLEEVCRRFDRYCRERPSEGSLDCLARFQELWELERQLLAGFERVAEPAAARLEAIRRPVVPEGVRKVIFIGCPDLPAGVLEAAAHLPVPVEVWIGAPAAELSRFDDWGRPRQEWLAQPLELDCRTRVRRFGRPDEQAAKLADLLANPEYRPSAIGVLDEEVAESLVEKLQYQQPELPVYAPQSRKLSALPWTRLLLDLLALAEDSVRFELIARLARNALVQDFALTVGLVDDWPGVLIRLDQLESEHLLADWAELRDIVQYETARTAPPPALAELADWLERLAVWRRRLRQTPDLLRNAFEILAEIGRNNSYAELDLELSAVELAQLQRLVVEAANAARERPQMAKTLLTDECNHTEISIRADVEAAIDLVGFLELPWRPDRELVVAGFNEENFHYRRASDALLPERTRELLGMTTDKMRYAADVFRLKALLESRRLTILYGKASLNGDVLRPGRLLMQCGPALLPDRIRLLFSGALDESPVQPVRLAGAGGFPPYMPRRVGLLNRHLSVTAFQSYLNCPFQFYLNNVLRIRELNDRSIELDHMQFGNLLHEVLRRLGDGLEPSGDPAVVDAFCQRELEKVVRHRLNGGRRGIVRLQCGIMAQNLHYFAAVQAQEYDAGWRIRAVELPFSFRWDQLYSRVFPTAGKSAWRSAITLDGRLDRLDWRRSEQGIEEWRLIDYKTGSAGSSPAEKHVISAAAAWGDEEKEARYAFEKSSGSRSAAGYWADLQLPLYLLIAKYILADEFAMAPDAVFSAAYFNLPLAFTDTRLAVFDELERPEVLQNAVRCADWVLRRIFVEAVFWPPRQLNGRFDRRCELIGSTSEADYIALEQIPWHPEEAADEPAL